MVIIVSKSFHTVQKLFSFVFFWETRVNGLGYCCDSSAMISATIIFVLQHGPAEFRAQTHQANLHRLSVTMNLWHIKSSIKSALQHIANATFGCTLMTDKHIRFPLRRKTNHRIYKTSKEHHATVTLIKQVSLMIRIQITRKKKRNTEGKK